MISNCLPMRSRPALPLLRPSVVVIAFSFTCITRTQVAAMRGPANECIFTHLNNHRNNGVSSPQNTGHSLLRNSVNECVNMDSYNTHIRCGERKAVQDQLTQSHSLEKLEKFHIALLLFINTHGDGRLASEPSGLHSPALHFRCYS